jgi:hypothetical protein
MIEVDDDGLAFAEPVLARCFQAVNVGMPTSA